MVEFLEQRREEDAWRDVGVPAVAGFLQLDADQRALVKAILGSAVTHQAK